MTLSRVASSGYRSTMLATLVALALSSSCAAAATLQGFVTKIDSPTAFHMTARQVRIDSKTACFREERTSYIGMRPGNYFGLWSRRLRKSKVTTSCESVPLRVGSYVQVVGNCGQKDGSFIAAQLTMYAVTVREGFTNYRWSNRRWTGGALTEEKPHISQAEGGWVGTLWLDGYPMRIGSQTKILTAPNGTVMGFGFFSMSRPQQSMGAVMPRTPAPAFSAFLFEPNTWAAYQGVGPPEIRHVLDQIRLWPNRETKQEETFGEQLAVRIQPPDYADHVEGKLQFENRRRQVTLRILPDQNVQGFVTKIGTSLIPEYQRALPQADETKVHFRFYAVRMDGRLLDDDVSRFEGVGLLAEPTGNDTAGAFPDGVIVIPDYTLARISSEAQLASILSSAIAVVLQKEDSPIPTAHGWGAVFGSLAAAGPFYLHNSSPPDYHAFMLPLTTDEQMLRVGIRQMYLAGYDIREAPFAWAAAIGKPFVNPLTDPTQSANGVPWYTAYAFNYLSQFYSDVDYSKLKRGEAEYAQFLQELRQADPGAFHGQ